MVQPGTVHATLQRGRDRRGLRFGPDPSTHTRCTIGGMIGNNACGSRALGYGRTADNVRRRSTSLTGAGDRLRGRSGRRRPALDALVDAPPRHDPHRASAASPGRSPATPSSTCCPRTAARWTGSSSAPRAPSRSSPAPRCAWSRTRPCRVLAVLGYPTMADAADAVPALLGARARSPARASTSASPRLVAATAPDAAARGAAGSSSSSPARRRGRGRRARRRRGRRRRRAGPPGRHRRGRAAGAVADPRGRRRSRLARHRPARRRPAGRTPRSRRSGSAPTCATSTRCSSSTGSTACPTATSATAACTSASTSPCSTAPGRVALPGLRRGRRPPRGVVRRQPVGRARRRPGPLRAAAADVRRAGARPLRPGQGGCSTRTTCSTPGCSSTRRRSTPTSGWRRMPAARPRAALTLLHDGGDLVHRGPPLHRGGQVPGRQHRQRRR